VRELKAAGHDIVDMTIGEPDFDTPDTSRPRRNCGDRQGQRSVYRRQWDAALAAAIISDYKRRLGLDYSEKRNLCRRRRQADPFPGLMASVEEGAEVIIPAPTGCHIPTW